MTMYGAMFYVPLDTKLGHFGDVLPSEYLGLVLRKPNPTKLTDNTKTNVI